MKNSLFFIVIVLISLLACNKDIPSSTDTSQMDEIHLLPNHSSELLENEVLQTVSSDYMKDIYSRDSAYVIGQISYDTITSTFTITEESTAINDYLNSLSASAAVSVTFSEISLELEDDQLYLYYKAEKSNGVILNMADEVLIFDILPNTPFSDLGIGWDTHTCDGSCGGANTVLTQCYSCSFKKVGGKIIGCVCSGFGTCCHSVSTNETPRF